MTYSVPDFVPHYMMKEDIPKGQIYDYVMASSAYPAFKWQKIEGNENKWFIDGGVYDNMPVKMLVDKGYDEIVAIRTNIKNTARTARRLKGRETSGVYPQRKARLRRKLHERKYR